MWSQAGFYLLQYGFYRTGWPMSTKIAPVRRICNPSRAKGRIANPYDGRHFAGVNGIGSLMMSFTDWPAGIIGSTCS